MKRYNERHTVQIPKREYCSPYIALRQLAGGLYDLEKIENNFSKVHGVDDTFCAILNCDENDAIGKALKNGDIETVSEECQKMEEQFGEYLVKDEAFNDFSEANISVSPVYYDEDMLGHSAEIRFGDHEDVRILSFEDTVFFYDDTGNYCVDDRDLSHDEFIKEAKNALKYQVQIMIQFWRR